MNEVRRKVASVCFSEKEWDFVQNNIPKLIPYSAYIRDLVLKHLNYPHGVQTTPEKK